MNRTKTAAGATVTRRRVAKPRRPKINVQRAQVASQRLIAAECRDLGWLWNRQEALLSEASTRAEAIDAARPLIEVCLTCPIVNECRAWAVEDSYSGVAAGTVWHEGRESVRSWTPAAPDRLDEAS